ncbi:hypothetical protein [Methylobacterium oryzihabitans]|uniref:hypothetical protein n=1 Tax=Methylobacterium oryzihabitans TaxID=2499852 RepID=UPI001FECF1DF|nr:hypothetical protein [Methylobacterium oryzihabitans]
MFASAPMIGVGPAGCASRPVAPSGGPVRVAVASRGSSAPGRAFDAVAAGASSARAAGAGAASLEVDGLSAALEVDGLSASRPGGFGPPVRSAPPAGAAAVPAESEPAAKTSPSWNEPCRRRSRSSAVSPALGWPPTTIARSVPASGALPGVWSCTSERSGISREKRRT